MMNRRDFIFLGGAALASGGGALALTSARAENEARSVAPFYIVGDSIGEGLVWFSGEKGDTRRGISIAGAYAQIQLNHAPEGSRIVISLGTNDAISQHGPSVAAVLKLITHIESKRPASWTWVGPVNPRKAPWGPYAAKIDHALRALVEARGGRYVSAYGLTELMLHHAKDGVHYDLAGYKLLWEAVRAGV